MKQKTVIFSSLGLVPAFFTPVIADDLGAGPTQPGTLLAQGVPPAAFTWTGFYVGLNAGFIQNSAHDTGFVPDSGGTQFLGCWNTDCGFKQTETATGLLGGVQLGYNFQFGNLVLGAEADADWSSATHNRQHSVFFGTDYTWRAHTGIEALSTARLRAGYTFGGALAYVTGGLAVGRIRSAYRESESGDVYSWSDRSGWRVGYAGGAGIELAAGPRWSIKGEALYYNFPDKVKHVSAEPGGGGDAFGLKDSVSGYVGRLGVNYRF